MLSPKQKSQNQHNEMTLNVIINHTQNHNTNQFIANTSDEKQMSDHTSYSQLVRNIFCFQYFGDYIKLHLKPKYLNLKEETLQNPHFSLSPHIWNQMLNTSKALENSPTMRQIATLYTAKYDEKTALKWMHSTKTVKLFEMMTFKLHSSFIKCLREKEHESNTDTTNIGEPINETERFIQILDAAIDVHESTYGNTKKKLSTPKEEIMNYFISNPIDCDTFKNMAKTKFSKHILFKKLKIKMMSGTKLHEIINKMIQKSIPTNDSQSKPQSKTDLYEENTLCSFYWFAIRLIFLNKYVPPISLYQENKPYFCSSPSASHAITLKFSAIKGMILENSSTYPLINGNALFLSNYSHETRDLEIKRFHIKPISICCKTIDDMYNTENNNYLMLSSKIQSIYFAVDLFTQQIFSMSVHLEYWLCSFLYLHCYHDERINESDNSCITKTKFVEELQHNSGKYNMLHEKINRFRKYPNQKQIIKIERISDNLKPYFMDQINTRFVISFDKIIKIFENAREIHFLNSYEFNDTILSKLVQHIYKNPTTKLKAIKFLYCDSVCFSLQKFNKTLLSRLQQLQWEISRNNIGDRITEIKLYSNGNIWKSMPKIRAKIESEKYGAQYSIIEISKTLTSVAATGIKEIIPHMYSYMIKGFMLQTNNEYVHCYGEIKIFNFDLHDKNTNETLYFVAEQYNRHNFRWKMINRIFTSNDIYNEFDISMNQLPSSWKKKRCFVAQLNHKQGVHQLLQNQAFIHQMIKKTHWHKHEKITIHNKNENKQRITFSVDKNEFINMLYEYFINHNKYTELIPIIMPNSTGNDHHVEFLQLIKIRIQNQQFDIGLSYKFDDKMQTIKPVAIHLDKHFIQSQHQLISKRHICHCLDNFESTIDHLTIGNPDYHKNNSSKYKNMWEIQKKQIKKLEKKLKPKRLSVSTTNNYHIHDNMDSKSETLTSKNQQQKSQIGELTEINNFYFQQTLNPYFTQIIPHPKHQQLLPPMLPPLPPPIPLFGTNPNALQPMVPNQNMLVPKVPVSHAISSNPQKQSHKHTFPLSNRPIASSTPAPTNAFSIANSETTMPYSTANSETTMPFSTANTEMTLRFSVANSETTAMPSMGNSDAFQSVTNPKILKNKGNYNETMSSFNAVELENRYTLMMQKKDEESRQKIQSLENELKVKEGELMDKDNLIRDNEHKLKSERGEVDQLNKRLKELSDEKNIEFGELKEKLQRLNQQKIKEIDEWKEKIHNINEKNNDEIDKLKQQIHNITVEKKNEIEQLKQNIQDMCANQKHEIEQLQHKLQQITDEKQHTIDELEQRLNDINNRYEYDSDNATVNIETSETSQNPCNLMFTDEIKFELDENNFNTDPSRHNVYLDTPIDTTTLNQQTLLDIQQIVDESFHNPTDNVVTEPNKIRSMQYSSSAPNQLQNIMYYLAGGDQETKSQNSNESNKSNSQKSNKSNDSTKGQNNNNSNNISGGAGGNDGGRDGNGRKNGNNDDGKKQNNQEDDDDDEDEDEDENKDEDDDDDQQDVENSIASKLNVEAPKFIPHKKHCSLITINEKAILPPIQSAPIIYARITQSQQETIMISSNMNRCESQPQIIMKNTNSTNTYKHQHVNGNNKLKNKNQNKKQNTTKKLSSKQRQQLKLQQMYIRMNNKPYVDPIETAKKNVYISNKLIRNIKKKTMSISIEKMDNIRTFMNSVFEIHHESKSESDLQILGFGFIDKETRQDLYCSLKPQQLKHDTSQYKLNDYLQLSETLIPKYRFGTMQTATDKVIKIMKKYNTDNIFKNCDWNKVPIITKKNDQFRWTVSVTKEQLLIRTKRFNANQINLIPIVSYDKTNISFAWIIKIHAYIYIALSLNYEEQNGNITVNGIYLDKEDLLMRHYLAYPPHMNECKCLNEFESIINDINIGNCDIWFNKIKTCEKKHKFVIDNDTNNHESKTPVFENESDDSRKEIFVNTPLISTSPIHMFSTPTLSINSATSSSFSPDQQPLCPLFNQTVSNFPPTLINPYFLCQQQSISNNVYTNDYDSITSNDNT